eukprot:TRINITY_DN102995_c0_g1_i1.p1 TRINITY_DN102995_c0_g1~~TRINITY_DN102995_c0_g1_i1.p1  ORF type:complete len:189 (+),score=69.27 TRINITY_DN102995_c0_g1_i1:95-661(+)
MARRVLAASLPLLWLPRAVLGDRDTLLDHRVNAAPPEGFFSDGSQKAAGIKESLDKLNAEAGTAEKRASKVDSDLAEYMSKLTSLVQQLTKMNQASTAYSKSIHEEFKKAETSRMAPFDGFKSELQQAQHVEELDNHDDEEDDEDSDEQQELPSLSDSPSSPERKTLKFSDSQAESSAAAAEKRTLKF